MRKLILFIPMVLLPAVAVGISNFTVFQDSVWIATIMLVVTVAVSAVFTWQSGAATPKIARYCICADFVICLVLCVNLGAHFLLAREVSAARQGVEERRAEEDRQERLREAEAARQLALKKAEAELQREERRRLQQLPLAERRSVLASKPAPTPASLQLAQSGARAEVSTAPPRTPEEVRAAWWWTLTALAFAEAFASVLAACILAGLWEWDRNKDGIPDHLQTGAVWPQEIDLGK